MEESKGKGTIMVETKKENLLSIGQMMEKGYALHFEGDICTIYDNYNKRQEIAQNDLVYFLKEKSKLLEYSRSLKPSSINKMGNL
ncbi:hypothetical protein CR513_47281, partial [Mucuna pruriens]